MTTTKPVKHIIGTNGQTLCGLSVRTPGIRLTNGVNVPATCDCCKAAKK
jgi:hypothetical protein